VCKASYCCAKTKQAGRDGEKSVPASSPTPSICMVTGVGGIDVVSSISL